MAKKFCANTSSGTPKDAIGCFGTARNTGCDVQREDDYAYAQEANGVGTARSVLAATQEAGVDGAEWVEHADVPFPFRGGVRLPDQAQIDPMPLLNSLVTELEDHGGRLFEGVRVTSISGTGLLRIAVEGAASAGNGRSNRFR